MKKRVYIFVKKATEGDIIARDSRTTIWTPTSCGFPSSELVHRAVVQVKTGKELSPKPNFVPEGTEISQGKLILQNFYYLGLQKHPKAAHGTLPFLLQTPLVAFGCSLQVESPRCLRDTGSNFLVVKMFFLINASPIIQLPQKVSSCFLSLETVVLNPFLVSQARLRRLFELCCWVGASGWCTKAVWQTFQKSHLDPSTSSRQA